MHARALIRSGGTWVGPGRSSADADQMSSLQRTYGGAVERGDERVGARARDRGQPRPIPSRIEGIGAPLGPLPPSFAGLLLGSTTAPTIYVVGMVGSGVGPLGGPGLGRAERRGWRRRRDELRAGRRWPGWQELSSDVVARIEAAEGVEGEEREACRSAVGGAPVAAWKRTEDCSRPARSRSGWATRSATPGGWGEGVPPRIKVPGRKYVRFAEEDIQRFVREGRQPASPASHGVGVSATGRQSRSRRHRLRALTRWLDAPRPNTTGYEDVVAACGPRTRAALGTARL